MNDNVLGVYIMYIFFLSKLMEFKEQNINDDLMLDFEANQCFIIGLLPYTQLNDNDLDINYCVYINYV